MLVLKKVNELFPSLFFKPKNLHIRKATNADVFEIINMIQTINLEHKLESEKKSPELLNIQENFSKGMFLVAEDDGKLVATAALKMDEKHIAELSHIFVSKSYRKNGIASELLQMLVQQAKLKQATMIKASFNKAWRKLPKQLTKLGFASAHFDDKQENEIQFYYDLRH